MNLKTKMSLKVIPMTNHKVLPQPNQIVLLSLTRGQNQPQINTQIYLFSTQKRSIKKSYFFILSIF